MRQGRKQGKEELRQEARGQGAALKKMKGQEGRFNAALSFLLD